MRETLKLLAAVLICLGAGALGSLFTASAIDTWYAALVRPALSPPNWVFGPVWTLLYVLMGAAVYLVLRTPAGRKRHIATMFFAVQLVLNACWSVLFFGLRSPGLALIEIGILWLAIVATIIVFARVSKPAAWLLVPYIAWVSFAVYLNYSFWALN